MSQKPKDLFDLFCDFALGPAQREIGLQLLLAAAIYLSFQLVWSGIRPSVAEQNDYQIDVESIVLTPKPLWIPPSLEERAIENNTKLGERPRLSLLDPGLADDLMSAFRSEPWIRDIRFVKLRYPATVVIDADYREPVAFVETSSTVENGISSRTTYQVDADGILLPTDFIAAAVSTDPSAIHDYLWIVGLGSTPVGVYGKPWGDPVLDEAALLADFLRSDFKQLEVAKIIASAGTEHSETSLENRSKQRVWRLETAGGKKIIWGSFPMSRVIHARNSPRSEYEAVKAEAFRKEEPKLARLRDLADGKGLDSLPDEQFPIDLSEVD